ncbi:MAG: RNA-guided endonuclease InsQ/TnpB family protein [Methylovirgula sp.]
MIRRGFKYRLYPTAEQETNFKQIAGICRAIYNAALFQRQHFGRRGKTSYASQCRELTQLRAEFDWIKACPQTAQQQALKDLDQAFQNFFAGRAKYPTPRKKGRNESFRFHGRECPVTPLNRNWASVHLPKVGPLRFRLTRPLAGTIKNLTVSLDSSGWHISFACEIAHETTACTLPAVGIDRGIANTIALSTGEMPAFPMELIRVFDRKYRKAQQARARRKRGSNRHAEARRRASTLKAKAARVRRHWNHVQTTRISKHFGIVCLEDLKIANMTASARGTIATPGRMVRQKAGLNRAILEQGWHQFEMMLSYKLAAAGGELRLVDPKNTSRKCAKCGAIDARNREIQALFRCISCSHEDHADINAATNILQAGTRPSVRTLSPPRKSRLAA